MALPTGNEETIIWRIVAETQEAMMRTKAFRQLVDETKETLRKTSEETGQSFKVVGTALKLAFSEESKERIREIREEMQGLSASVKAYNTILKEKIPSPDRGEKLGALAPDVGRYRELKDELMAISIEGMRMRAAVGRGVGELDADARKAAQGVKTLKTSVMGVGDVLKLVFVGLLGGSVIGIFRQFVSLLAQAVQSAFEFGKALFTLEVGIRALRRAGKEITTKDI